MRARQRSTTRFTEPTEVFLDILTRKPESSIQKFFDMVREQKSKQPHIFARLFPELSCHKQHAGAPQQGEANDTATTLTLSTRTSAEASSSPALATDSQWEKVLIPLLPAVVDALRPSLLLDHLRACHLLTPSEYDQLQHQSLTERDRSRKLLNTLLPGKGKGSFAKFCRFLSVVAGQQHIVTKVLKVATPFAEDTVVTVPDSLPDVSTVQEVSAFPAACRGNTRRSEEYPSITNHARGGGTSTGPPVQTIDCQEQGRTPTRRAEASFRTPTEGETVESLYSGLTAGRSQEDCALFVVKRDVREAIRDIEEIISSMCVECFGIQQVMVVSAEMEKMKTILKKWGCACYVDLDSKLAVLIVFGIGRDQVDSRCNILERFIVTHLQKVNPHLKLEGNCIVLEILPGSAFVVLRLSSDLYVSLLCALANRERRMELSKSLQKLLPGSNKAVLRLGGLPPLELFSDVSDTGSPDKETLIVNVKDQGERVADILTSRPKEAVAAVDKKHPDSAYRGSIDDKSLWRGSETHTETQPPEVSTTFEKTLFTAALPRSSESRKVRFGFRRMRLSSEYKGVTAFVLYNHEDPYEKEVYSSLFEPALRNLGCKCATAQQAVPGVSKLECFEYLIEHCPLQFIFPMPDLDDRSEAHHVRERMVSHSIKAKDKCALIPVRFTNGALSPTYCDDLTAYYDHITAVLLDTENPQLEMNDNAWEHIKRWIDLLMDAESGSIGHSDKSQTESPQDLKISPDVTRVSNPTPDIGLRKRHPAETGTTESLETVDRSVHLLKFHLHGATWMTCKLSIAFVVVVLLIDLLREVSLFCADDHYSDDRPINWLGVLPVFFKVTAGILSIGAFARYASSLNSLNLKEYLTSKDIENIKKYLIKENLLREMTGDLQEADVLSVLKEYLLSTDKMFLVFPWLHTGMIVCLLFNGGLFHHPGYNDMPEWAQVASRLVDAVTTFGVIGIGHSAVSLYHVQYKVLIDIYKVASYAPNSYTSGASMSQLECQQKFNSCGQGIRNTWQKLRNQVERTALRCFYLLVAAIPFQLYLLAWEAWYYLSGMQEKSSIVVISAAVLLFSEALANCPYRWMKKTGLTLDSILLLASFILPATPIPYGTTQLIIFRLLSFKLTCVLFLQIRLMTTTGDWPYDVPKAEVKSERFWLLVIFWLSAILLDILLAS